MCMRFLYVRNLSQEKTYILGCFFYVVLVFSVENFPFSRNENNVIALLWHTMFPDNIIEHSSKKVPIHTSLCMLSGEYNAVFTETISIREYIRDKMRRNERTFLAHSFFYFSFG